MISHTQRDQFRKGGGSQDIFEGVSNSNPSTTNPTLNNNDKSKQGQLGEGGMGRQEYLGSVIRQRKKPREDRKIMIKKSKHRKNSEETSHRHFNFINSGIRKQGHPQKKGASRQAKRFSVDQIFNFTAISIFFYIYRHGMLHTRNKLSLVESFQRVQYQVHKGTTKKRHFFLRIVIYKCLRVFFSFQKKRRKT